jgi:hypothetical protein
MSSEKRTENPEPGTDGMYVRREPRTQNLESTGDGCETRTENPEPGTDGAWP